MPSSLLEQLNGCLALLANAVCQVNGAMDYPDDADQCKRTVKALELAGVACDATKEALKQATRKAKVRS